MAPFCRTGIFLTLVAALVVYHTPSALGSESKSSPSPTELDIVQQLAEYLTAPPADRPPLASQPFATMRLTADEASQATALLWNDYQKRIRSERAGEMEQKVIKIGDLEMPFFYKAFGEKPRDGRSLYISLHGGGNAPARVNDRQWENQKRLYELEEGVYLVPRAPTNTWNLWHESHIDDFFDRLITNMIVWEGVNPDRVYVMGYSAGGDGVFQLAPRMADRWAAAAMMAGHPNETVPLGLRNIGFTIHMGGRDAAYDRNKVAEQWKQKLAELQQADPEGYAHEVVIYPDKGHWMDREDAAALAWMAKFQRNPFPTRIVWFQDDVTHKRYYWLTTPEPEAGTHVVAQRQDQTVDITTSTSMPLTILLNDTMVDLDQPVRVVSGDTTLFDGKVPRTITTLFQTLNERGDPRSVFSAQVEVSVEPSS